MRTSAMVAALLAAALAACATHELDPELKAEAEKPLICSGAEQCTAAWRAGQVWVATHSGYKVQTVSDSILQTYGPPGAISSTYAYELLRMPQGDGTERIVIKPFCGSIPLCSASPLEVAVDFKRTVTNAIGRSTAAAPTQ